MYKYAFSHNIESIYLNDIFDKKILVPFHKTRSLKIDAAFLNCCQIFINRKELTQDLWLRPKSKSIFLYFIYQTYCGMEITKESIIDNILYNTKNSNYKALVDVEINKVRITFQSFLSELFQEKIEKEVLIYKDKKYFLVSKNMELDIKIDVDEFKKLCSSKNINDLKKAFEMYKTDFAKDLYNNWAEDIRENLRFMYTDLIYKLITHFEREKDNNSLIN